MGKIRAFLFECIEREFYISQPYEKCCRILEDETREFETCGAVYKIRQKETGDYVFLPELSLSWRSRNNAAPHFDCRLIPVGTQALVKAKFSDGSTNIVCFWGILIVLLVILAALFMAAPHLFWLWLLILLVAFPLVWLLSRLIFHWCAKSAQKALEDHLLETHYPWKNRL